MSRLIEFKMLLDEYDAAEITASALEDISALQMQAIRSGFEKNRGFFQDIGELYGTIQASAPMEKRALEVRGGNRQLYVAVTSNKRFYGNLMRDVIAALSRALAAAPQTNALIIGRVGWQYFEESNHLPQARQFFFADDNPTTTEFEELMKHLDTFDHVFVLYPKFINPFRQDVGITDITQSPASQEKKPDAVDKKTERETYIFEPEIASILAFFDAQVKRILFRGVLLEAELARTAARFMRMEEAHEHAHQMVVETRARVRREIASVSNTELLETFAGFTKWKQL